MSDLYPEEALNFLVANIADIVGKGNEDRCWRAAMPAAAIAMTPEHPFGFAVRTEADVAAETAA